MEHRRLARRPTARIASSLVLVRLLSPSDYGLAGMAIIVLAFVATFQDVGFGAGLVQRRTITEADRSTVFWTTVAIGSFLTVLMIALSGAIAAFFHEPEVQNLVIVGSLTLVHRLARDDSGLTTAPSHGVPRDVHPSNHRDRLRVRRCDHRRCRGGRGVGIDRLPAHDHVRS